MTDTDRYSLQMHISRRARQTTLLLGPLVAAALLAACSSSSNGPAAGGSSTGAPAGTTPAVGSATPGGSSGSATGTGGAPDSKALTALMITKADLPAGWTGVKSNDSATTAKDAAEQAAFAQCVGIRNTEPDKLADVSSDDFTKQNSTVSSNASSYKSADDVTIDASAFRDKAKLGRCMTTMLESEAATQLPAGAKLGKFTLQVVPGSGGGPSNVVATISTSVKVTVSGTTLPVFINSVYIAGKQIEANLVLENIGAPVDAALQSKLVEALAGRVAGA